MRKYTFLFVLLLLTSAGIFAQPPVSWSFKLNDKGSGEVELTASAKIASGWHLYDVVIPDGGPNPTTLSIDELKGGTKVGAFKAINSKLHKEFDPLFQMNIGYYDTQATFVQRIKVTDKAAFSLKGDIRAQACNDSECTPPLPIEFSFKSKDLPTSVVENKAAGNDEAPSDATTTAVNENTQASADSAQVVTTPSNATALWTPLAKQLAPYDKEEVASTFWLIFLSGFLYGFVALLTPCVWPMIPMTVSFFLKRNKKSRSKAIKDALTYSLGIIVIYVTLGLLITAIFGASALNDMATSATFNLIFFALLVVFGISFLGAFEIMLPASWSSKMDSKADSTTGIISIFFMAFTLALVSFSCTGPLIGTLLVQAGSSGSMVAPAFGMFGFALALSIPFGLFAIFPSLLESMPKSGGWLNSVKVVLGFAELALALKFFSVADLAYGWRILDREVFLVLWIVIFALLGMYLLGKLKFSHDSDLKYVSVPRLILAIISFAFAVYLVPGLWGAPLKMVSAFTPPLTTQDFNLYNGSVHAKFDDYETGMEYAKRTNKPVMIDFSGYGCVNCRKMEASVWTNPQVKQILEKDYVLITLMVDDKAKLPEVLTVTETNGSTSKLKTIGDKWSYLQRNKFGTNSQPYYVLLDGDGNPIINKYFAYDEDVKKYIDFLQIGLDNYKKLQEVK